MRHKLLTAFFVFAQLVSLTVQAEPRVVASIRPLHALLSSIMHDVAEPALLMGSNQSPHHYSLRPSERRQLADADIIFWIGPGLEGFMPRLLNSLDKKTAQVALIDTPGVTLLPLRTLDDHAGNDHDTRHGSSIDPHIWLNTHNLETIANAMTTKLVNIDPPNSENYERNNQRLIQQLAMLRQSLHRQLDAASQPFLTYHDGYQYFEHEFGLDNRGFVSIGADFQPGAGHVRELRKRIEQQSIQCVFYDAPNEPSILRSLVKNTGARPVALDATGMTLPAGNINPLQIMRTLGENFSACLNPPG